MIWYVICFIAGGIVFTIAWIFLIFPFILGNGNQVAKR